MQFLNAEGLATWILGELDRRLQQRSLQRFGDAPFEVDIANELRASALDPDIIEGALNRAIQLSLASIFGQEKKLTAYDNLASLSLISRYLNVGAKDWEVSEALSFLTKAAGHDQTAIEALSTFLRTLCRTESFPDMTALRSLASHPDARVRRPALEALGRLGSEHLIHALAHHLSLTPENNAQLLWTLAHDEKASKALSQNVDDPELSSIGAKMRVALSEIDPTGAAYSAWVDTVETPVPVKRHSFQDFDWRLKRRAA